MVFAGYGLFATKDFGEKEFIADYCGELISYEQADKISDQTYLFYFHLGSKRFWYVNFRNGVKA